MYKHIVYNNDTLKNFCSMNGKSLEAGKRKLNMNYNNTADNKIQNCMVCHNV